MHEDLTRLQPTNLISGHSGVSAADPKILRGLYLDQFLEKGGVFFGGRLGPDSVVLHYLLEVVHRDLIAAEVSQLHLGDPVLGFSLEGVGRRGERLLIFFGYLGAGRVLGLLIARHLGLLSLLYLDLGFGVVLFHLFE